MPLELAIKTRYLNVIFFVTGIWSCSMLIGVSIIGRLELILIIMGGILYQATAFLFNINNRQFISWCLVSFGYTTYLFCFWIFLDSAWDPGFSHLVFIFLTFIFFKGKSQFIIVGYTSFLYLIAPVIEPLIPAIYKSPIDTLPNATEYCFWLYLGFSSVIFAFYQAEIQKERDAKEAMIKNLLSRNKELNEVQEELAQFVTVVSQELKNQVEIVQQENQKIEIALIQKKMSIVSQSLETANASAQQMYVWVNEVLE